MPHGKTLLMRNIRRPEPVYVHQHMPGEGLFGAPPARVPYINLARDTKRHARLRVELRDRDDNFSASTYTCTRCEAQFGIAGEHTGSDDDYAADEYFASEVEYHESGACVRTAVPA